MERICILILNWNGKDDTLGCLASLQHLTYASYEIVVIDNGSTDDSVSAIKAQYPDLTLIETGANLGFAGGNNVGIEYALAHAFDSVLLLNNDTTVDPDLLTAFASSPHPIQGAKLHLFDKPDTLDHLGGNWNPQTGEFDPIGRRARTTEYNAPLPMDYACGAALFIRRAVFETIGLLEPRFFLYWEESDFCIRAKKANFETWYNPGAKVWHKVGASLSGGNDFYHTRNRLFFISRNCSTKLKIKLYIKITRETLRKCKHIILIICQLPFTKPTHKPLKTSKLHKNKQSIMGYFKFILNRL